MSDQLVAGQRGSAVMVRFFIKLVIWVTVARWIHAETTLVVPKAVPYINAAISKIDIPTHDKWRNSLIGQYVAARLPSSDSVKQQLSANMGLPLKESAGLLQDATAKINAATVSSFERF